MGKYQPLEEYLKNCGKMCITLSYEEIEKIIGESLPKSGTEWKSSWWGNDKTHVQSAAWQNAGYQVAEVKPGISVTFRKI